MTLNDIIIKHLKIKDYRLEIIPMKNSEGVMTDLYYLDVELDAWEDGDLAFCITKDEYDFLKKEKSKNAN